MEMRDVPETTPVPGIIKVLGESCNLVAGKVYLMAAPILLDMLLLFGPKLRVAEYFRPYFDSAFKQLSNTTNSGIKQLEMSIDLLMQTLESVNLFGFLQTYPIGIRTIFSAGSAETPLGKSPEIQMTSLLQIIPLIIILSVLGVLFGTFYYSITAAAARKSGKFRWNTFGTQLLNVILLYIALIVLIVLLMVPCGCMLTFSMMISPVIYQILILLLMVIACWLIIPLFFIPQAIFMKGLDFPNAVKDSLKLSSWAGTITVRYILLSLVLTFGLDMIWAIPEKSSWLVLFSIFGHAFVSTSILASSFILYKELDQWQKENQSFLEWRKANLRIKQLFKKETETHE